MISDIDSKIIKSLVFIGTKIFMNEMIATMFQNHPRV